MDPEFKKRGPFSKILKQLFFIICQSYIHTNIQFYDLSVVQEIVSTCHRAFTYAPNSKIKAKYKICIYLFSMKM